MSDTKARPVLIITGAAGRIGASLAQSLRPDYFVIGLDVRPAQNCDKSMICDLSSAQSVRYVMGEIRKSSGAEIRAVLHLAAYYDFTGRLSPLYKKINEDGTENLLEALQDFSVGRFVYSGTMLVHRPAPPGQRIDEDSPLGPRWAYPQSKARTEMIIRDKSGGIPYTILRLAGLYDETQAVPTLSHQIARIYEKDFHSHLYAGDMGAGQAFIHREDMLQAFRKTVERAAELPQEGAILIGEADTESYAALQNRIGALIHGQKVWKTWRLPKAVAKPGAWLEEKAEVFIPDSLDQGEKPFIRPFMIDMASDHYALDTSRAEKLLGWRPERSIGEELPALINSLKADPAGWYSANKIPLPDWVAIAAERGENPDRVRAAYIRDYRADHRRFLWAHFTNMLLAVWLATTPFALGYISPAMVWSDVISGTLLFVFSSLSLSWRHSWARWACGVVGIWLLAAPLVFWAPTAAAYLNGTFTGLFVIGFALLSQPVPALSSTAAVPGPDIPPGWEFSPSSWFQRMPVILFAVVGFFVSRYLAAYQLGHIEGVWEPFFPGSVDDPRNGTEEIITSSVSEAWPVPDAGLGAMTYALEMLTGMIGSAARWRTMPWLVMLFGFMIVPLGIVSITFIIIQPILLGTWCTLCLIAAAAMVIQIPYSMDELVATADFLWRKRKAGRPWLRIFFTGDSDDGPPVRDDNNFEQSPRAIFKDVVFGGVSFPWNLLACAVIGVWLMFTRLALGVEGGMADADHLIGALVVTVAVTALAETVRPVRLLIVPLGFALLITPFVFAAPLWSAASSLASGFVLIGLSLRAGPVAASYGSWSRFIR